jgi:hypothetical protein
VPRSNPGRLYMINAERGGFVGSAYSRSQTGNGMKEKRGSNAQRGKLNYLCRLCHPGLSFSAREGLGNLCKPQERRDLLACIHTMHFHRPVKITH